MKSLVSTIFVRNTLKTYSVFFFAWFRLRCLIPDSRFQVPYFHNFGFKVLPVACIKALYTSV